MKKEGGILKNVYNWVSGIVMVGDFVGCCSKNTYICIGASAALVCLSIGSLAMKYRKLQCLREQRERKLKRLDKRITIIKKALLNKDISENERDEMKEEEVTLLEKKTEVEEQYCKEEADIIQENQKRLYTCGIAFLILFVVNVVASLTYTSEKEMASMGQGESEQGVYGGKDNEVLEEIRKKDTSACGSEGKDEIDSVVSETQCKVRKI